MLNYTLQSRNIKHSVFQNFTNLLYKVAATTVHHQSALEIFSLFYNQNCWKFHEQQENN